MGLVLPPDDVFPFLLDRFGEPDSPHCGIRAVEQYAVFFNRHLLHEVVSLLGPSLKLFPGAFSRSKEKIPWMGRALVTLAVHPLKGFLEFLRVKLLFKLKHCSLLIRAAPRDDRIPEPPSMACPSSQRGSPPGPRRFRGDGNARAGLRKNRRTPTHSACRL